MKFATLLLLLAMTLTAAWGADSSSRNGAFINGRAWGGLSPAAKVGYVIGVFEGMWSTTFNNESGKAFIRQRFGNSTNGEIIDGLDDFYRDPANIQIEVLTAMKYYQDKLNGTSPKTLEEELAVFRKNAAASQ